MSSHQPPARIFYPEAEKPELHRSRASDLDPRWLESAQVVAAVRMTHR